MGAGAVVVIGGALALAGYAVGIYGYCMTRGYAVSFPEVWAPRWPGGKSTNAKAGGKGTAAGSPAQSPGLGRGVA
jgi:hypothetical protein